MIRQIFREFLWFITTGLIAFIVGVFLFEILLSNFALDIHLHDTYFVIDKAYACIPFIGFTFFLIYAIRVLKNNFSILFANWAMLLSGLLLIITLTLVTIIFFQLSFTELALYPPLSKLGPNKLSELRPNLLTHVPAKTLLVVDTLILLGLIYLTFKWGKAKRKPIDK